MRGGGQTAGPPANLTYRMLDTIGREIVTGHYADRRFPTEAELAEQHRVSRSVTREAVKMLTAKGLLTARPRKGTSIQPGSAWNLFDSDVLRWLADRSFSLELLRQFAELRAAIEPAAAELAARAADPAALAAIRAAYAQMETEEESETDGLAANIGFHIAILKASANPFYIQFRDVVASALQTSNRLGSDVDRPTANLAVHATVLEAIEKGDGDAARQAMARIIAADLMLIAEAERTA